MNALLKKEIRLLLPAFVAALALAILPIWFVPAFFFHAANDSNTTALVYCFGVLMLALASFGRENGLKTLPFMLTQPLERARVWWTKIAVLALFVVLAFDAWGLSNILCSIIRPVRLAPPEILASFGLFVAVFTAGGLWMTLLLRQTVAAFWLAVLIPMAAIHAMEDIGGAEWMAYAALGLYAVAAFFLARRQFLQMQDTAWTGGVISFRVGRTAAERSALRERRPWAALFWKEVQLQQVTLVGMGCLLALHLGAVALRKAGAHAFWWTTLVVLEGFGFLWFIVPLLAGSQSVAEERKFGTMQAHLCLPVSRRVQFDIKLLLVLVLGLSSAVLFWTVEQGIGGGNFIKLSLIFIFLLLALAGFYASTLTDGVLPALATAALILLGLWMTLLLLLPLIESCTGILLLFIASPVTAAALLWLSYRNFGNVSESWRLWWRNALALAATAAFAIGLTTAIYHRAWEWLAPLEPPHGPARLSPEKPSVLRNYDCGTVALLPDGRLWIGCLGRDPRRQFHGVSWGEKWMGMGGNEFAPGSNWVDAAASSREIVAIRSDGTLWVSEKPRNFWFDNGGLPLVEKPAALIQFGQDSNWLRVTPDLNQAMFLLKRDGTLWDWGINSFNRKQMWRSLRTFEPRRLGKDSDWAGLFQIQGWNTYFWKTNGSAWCSEWHGPHKASLLPGEQKVETGLYMERLPFLDDTRWRCLASFPFGISFAGIRDDGTLWFFNRHQNRQPRLRGSRALSTNAAKIGEAVPVRVGNDSDWADITRMWPGLVARKTDGSLWKWDSETLAAFHKPPVRLGTHSDWVALGSINGGIFSLAADGTLWSWPTPWPVGFSLEKNPVSLPLLAASRKPDRIENIFDARK